MDQVAAIRDKIDIVALIREYIPLKKAGQNFKTNCPFHSEKTPSFVVSPQRQIWHCFGCQKGGDCFTFLMEYEHIEFPEALRILAQKAGVELTQYKFETGLASKKEKIYQINKIACEYFHYVLTKHPAGKRALEYLLEERKIKLQTINTYMLGFSPNERDALVVYLSKKKNFSKDEIIDAGLAVFYGGRLKDFFQGRLIFPLYDHRSNIIGFSGRILENSHAKSKYINTRETLVYHKGSVFFGLNLSKDAIKKANQTIITEGEFDVIACFQEGITNTVAVKGTALTEEQVNLISRFAQKITLCFDEDNAGHEAIKRSLPILEKKGLTTTVVVIPDGKDADESIKNNPIAFKNAVKKDIDIYDYLFDQALQGYSQKTAEGKKHIGDLLLPVFTHIQNEIVKEHHVRKLSNAIAISYEALVKEMEKIEKKEIIKKEIPFPTAQKSREELLEEYLIALIVQQENPYLFLEDLIYLQNVYVFHMPVYKRIIEYFFEFQKAHPSFDPKQFFASLPKELIAAFDVCFLLPLPKFADSNEYKKEVKRIIKEMRESSIKEQIKKIGDKMRTKDEDAQSELQNELLGLLDLLQKE